MNTQIPDEHDPLCTYGPEWDRMNGSSRRCPECELIVQVRADERRKAAEEIASQTEDEFRAHLIEVGRDAMGRNDGWRWWHPRHLARLLDFWEPLIRADERRRAAEGIAAYAAVLADLGGHEALYSCPGAGCYFTAGGPADELYGLKLKHINQTGHPAGPIEHRPDAPQVLDLAAIARRIWGAS